MAKETEHEKLLHEWQNRLGLQDWYIIFKPNCRPENMAIDFERTLVHELLQCKLSVLSDDDKSVQYRIVHQLIDDLARAFVDAKRSGDMKEENRTEGAPKPTYAALVPEYSGVRIVYAVCSNCGQTVQYPTERPYNACPYCAAKIIYKEEKT